MASTNHGKQVFLASMLIAAVISSQSLSPLKATVLQAKQTHSASSFTVTKEEKCFIHTPVFPSYLSAESQGQGAKVVTQTNPGPAETWTLQTLSNGKVAMKSCYGTYIKARVGDPSNPLDRNDIFKTIELGNILDDSAAFDLITNADGTVSFKTYLGTYLNNFKDVPPLDRVGTLYFLSTPNRFVITLDRQTAVGSAVSKTEKVRIVVNNGFSNYYVKPSGDGDKASVLLTSQPGPDTEWIMEYYTNSAVGFKNVKYLTYLSATPGNFGSVEMRKVSTASPWETFSLIKKVDGTNQVKTNHGTYLNSITMEGQKVRIISIPPSGFGFRFLPSA